MGRRGREQGWRRGKEEGARGKEKQELMVEKESPWGHSTAGEEERRKGGRAADRS